MSGKPRWCQPGPVPLAGALSAAAHHAWLSGEGAPAFLAAFRQLVGHDAADKYELRALAFFNLQPEPPAGYDVPPASAHMAICPRCRMVRRTKHTRPQGGRVKLQALRDADWLEAQYTRGRSEAAIAKSLGCAPALVGYWADQHGLTPPKVANAEGVNERVAALHREGRGPGGIARELGVRTHYVRAVLRRTGLATNKRGHVYHDSAWWTYRMRTLGWTKTECAREAGIVPHAATVWVAKFGLSDITERNARRKRVKFPALADPRTLADLLRKHGDNYERAAKEVGCAPSLVSRYARDLLGRAKKLHTDEPHYRPEWWEERVAAGRLAHEMAEEAGIAEATAREKLRLFGLSDRAYANEAKRERQRRSA